LVKFFLHLRHENSAPTPFWILSLGFVFTTMSLGCMNNTMIMHSGSESVSESSVNYCSRVLLILKFTVHVTGHKAYGRSHLHVNTFLTHFCCMIMNHGCELLNDLSLYTTTAVKVFIALSTVIVFQDLLSDEWIHRMSYAVKSQF